MSFHWSEYLSLAQELLRVSLPSSLHEASFRSAMSRAYYAAFGQARNYLISTERIVIPRGTNIHQYVIDTFEMSNEPAHQVIGHLLHHLRSTRNAADYDNVFSRDLRGVTRAALAEAEEVIQLLKTL
jgi:uncharacterized protein (UPF0332 family)